MFSQQDLPLETWIGKKNVRHDIATAVPIAARFRFHAPLRVGDQIQRTSTIANVKEKRGRTGHLAFVTVLHEIHGSGGPALTEEHDIVYRDMPGPDAPPTETPESNLAMQATAKFE